MNRKLVGLAFSIAGLAAGAAAQTGTPVTNSNNGVSGKVPVYSGTATLGDGNSSPITVTGSNVGIGATSPSSPLHVMDNANADPSLVYGAAAGAILNNGGVDIAFGTSNLSPYESWIQTRTASNLAGTLVLNPLGGSIGIGTTSPAGGSLVIGSQTVGRNARIVPFAYFGSSYGAWDTIFGSNVRAREGTTNPGYELGSSYNGQGASMFVSNLGNYSALYQWKASDISGYTEGQALTLPTPTIYFDPNRNVGIGTTSPGAKLELNGNLKLSSGSGASITFADGTVQSTAYTGITCGGDYAESVDVTGNRTNYEPGDVLVLDPDNPGKMLKSVEAYSTSVSGIYSTKPGTVGRRQTTPKSPDEVPMAVVGIVPAKVSTENGAIKVGDLLVTSSTPGYAMKGTDRGRMLGAVVGKAMAKLDSGTGLIEVLVTLQ